MLDRERHAVKQIFVRFGGSATACVTEPTAGPMHCQSLVTVLFSSRGTRQAFRAGRDWSKVLTTSATAQPEKLSGDRILEPCTPISKSLSSGRLVTVTELGNTNQLA